MKKEIVYTAIATVIITLTAVLGWNFYQKVQDIRGIQLFLQNQNASFDQAVYDSIKRIKAAELVAQQNTANEAKK